jgi:(1->4)-alpha-D-glucan 1-alpha-D-glucosylmutase
MVIGEDLGTVPDEVRDGLQKTRVMSYRVLYFERNAAQEYKPPGEYAVDALVAVSTHDLATLAGFWEGYDLEIRRQLDLFPSEDVRLDVVATRAKELERLKAALEREGLLRADALELKAPVMTPQLAEAIHVFLARTPSRLLAVQLEDVFGLRDQANLPGTVEEQPNWRRRLPLTLAQMERDERFVRLTEALGRARPRKTAGRQTDP